MDKLARYSGQADGTLQLNNVVAPSLEISVRKIDTDAGDGRYPQVKRVYGDVTSEELNRNAGLPPRSPPKDIASPACVECLRAYAGFGWMYELQRRSRAAVYHGKTVGPQDKGKLLLRWKLNDGRSRVLYGHLRMEDVSEARLKKLEGG